jgi:hypothetical protein
VGDGLPNQRARVRHGADIFGCNLRQVGI